MAISLIANRGLGMIVLVYEANKCVQSSIPLHKFDEKQF